MLIRRPPMEELSCVLIAADKKEKLVTVTSSSLDAFQIESIKGVDVEQPGVCLVKAKALKDMLSLITHDLTELKFDSKLHIKSPGMSVMMATMDHVQFPVAPVIGNRQFLVANFESLSRIKFAIPTNEERLNLFGAIIHQSGESLIAYASNGRVAGRVTTPCRGALTGTLFIPATHVDDVIAMGEVTVTQFDRWLAFENQISTLVMKQMSIEPMDVKSHLDRLVFNAKCTIGREELVSKIRAAHLLRRDSDSMVPFTIKQDTGSLGISVLTSNGALNEKIECRTFGVWGGWDEAKFPTDNFLAALNSESDVVKLHFGDRTSVLRIEDSGVDTYIMPMRS
jgi:DNA polymerase III sliding clamp (beta) subunit (PCNA family)